MDYDQFVQQKRRAEVATGHQPGNLNEHLLTFSMPLCLGRFAVAAPRSSQIGLFAAA